MKIFVCETCFWILHYVFLFINWLLPFGSSIKIDILEKIMELQHKIIPDL